MRIRTSYESMLEFKGIPLSMRRLLMGHENPDTSMTPYGSDQVSIDIRRDRLRKNLEQLEEKAFKGELLRYGQINKPKPSNKIIQLFTHLENPVFICKDRTKPTWKHSEQSLERGTCNSFEKCLFCEQCYVTVESLPFLIRWKRDIRSWLIEAPADRNIEIILYLQAIEEILELCSNENQTWNKALIDAEMKEMNPDFIAPPFWIGG